MTGIVEMNRCLDAVAGTMNCSFTTASNHRMPERGIISALSGHPGVRRVTVRA